MKVFFSIDRDDVINFGAETALVLSQLRLIQQFAQKQEFECTAKIMAERCGLDQVKITRIFRKLKKQKIVFRRQTVCSKTFQYRSLYRFCEVINESAK